MAARSDYSRDILTYKVEQLLWHIARIEARQPPDRVLQDRTGALSRLKCPVPRAVPQAAPAQAGDSVLPAPLRPACSMLHMITNAKPESVMLLDCRGLSQADMLQVWRNWPRESLMRGTVPVFILSVPPLDVMHREGAAMEWVAPPQAGNPAAVADQTIEFLCAKYGVDRVLRWNPAAPAAGPA